MQEICTIGVARKYYLVTIGTNDGSRSFHLPPSSTTFTPPTHSFFSLPNILMPLYHRQESRGTRSAPQDAEMGRVSDPGAIEGTLGVLAYFSYFFLYSQHIVEPVYSLDDREVFAWVNYGLLFGERGSAFTMVSPLSSTNSR